MDIARHWRLRKQRYGLLGEVCEACGVKLFPPRDVCPECLAPSKTPFVSENDPITGRKIIIDVRAREIERYGIGGRGRRS